MQNGGMLYLIRSMKPDPQKGKDEREVGIGIKRYFIG